MTILSVPRAKALVKPRVLAAATAVGLGLGAFVGAVGLAAPAAAAGGCGPGFHPNPWGICRPNWGPRPYWRRPGFYGGYGYVRPRPYPRYGFYGPRPYW